MKGHIRKRGKDTWSLIVDLGRTPAGKRQQRWHTVRGSKREAQQELRRLLTQLDNGTFAESGQITVGEYLERWLTAGVQPRVSAKTFSRYAEICRSHLIPAFGHIRLGKLRPRTIQEFYAKSLQEGRLRRVGKKKRAKQKAPPKPTGLSAQTVVHFHRVLRAALKQAVLWRDLAVNPADAVKPPRPEKREMRALAAAEIGQLLRAAEGTRLYAPVLVAVTTGLRRGELLGLRWSDVDMKGGTLTIQRSVEEVSGKTAFKPPKTAKGRRKIVLPAISVETLKRHRAEQAKDRLALGPDYQDGGLVFPCFDGSVWTPGRFSGAFQYWVKSIGLGHVRLHDLRHSHATQLLVEGIHPKVVSERLGHSTIAITLDTYSHVLPGLQQEAAEKVDTALRQVMVTTNAG